ncbi:MAG: hypothetical protein JKY37_07060 [Nannocystaceae bacterium]|nr:hypothetical protein [Nannocystaceae bacterium]
MAGPKPVVRRWPSRRGGGTHRPKAVFLSAAAGHLLAWSVDGRHQGLNGLTVVALVALLAVVLAGRTWLGLTGLAELDPLTLIGSSAVALLGLTFAVSGAPESAER